MARKPPPPIVYDENFEAIEDAAEAHFTSVAAEGEPNEAVVFPPGEDPQEPDREHKTSIAEMYGAYARSYDPQAAYDLIHRLFPHGTITTLERLTGVAVRMAARWSKGESRLPPRLWDKLTEQDAKRVAFEADLRDLVSRHVDGGLTRAVVRQVLLSAPEDESLKVPEQL